MDGHQVDQICRALLLLAKATIIANIDTKNPVEGARRASESERTLAQIEKEMKR